MSEQESITWTPEVPPSIAIITTLMNIEGSSIDEVPPLHNRIDPEALDSLITRSADDDSPVAVAFFYAGYTVQVTGEQEITFVQTVEGNGIETDWEK